MTLGSTQKQVDRKVSELLDAPPEAQGSVAQTLLEWAESTSESRPRNAVIQALTGGSAVDRRRILRTLFTMADYQTTEDEVVSERLPSARLIRLALEPQHTSIDVLTDYLRNRDITNGAAGVRLAMKLLPPDNARQEELRRTLVRSTECVIRAPDSDARPLPRSWHHAMRLLELLIRQRYYVEAATLWSLRAYVRDDREPTQACVLQVLRAAGAILPMSFVDHVVISFAFGIAQNAEKKPRLRCLAFSTLAVLLQREPLAGEKQTEEILRFCLSSLLEKGDWQSQGKAIAVSGICIMKPFLQNNSLMIPLPLRITGTAQPPLRRTTHSHSSP